MTDHEYFVNPKVKSGKCWDYDISNGTKFERRYLTNPSGGKRSISCLINHTNSIGLRVVNSGLWKLKDDGFTTTTNPSITRCFRFVIGRQFCASDLSWGHQQLSIPDRFFVRQIYPPSSHACNLLSATQIAGVR